MFMILHLGLKNIDFLGKMKAEKFALLMRTKARGGYVPNRERNHLARHIIPKAFPESHTFLKIKLITF